MVRCFAVGSLVVLATLATILPGCGSGGGSAGSGKPSAAAKATPKTPPLGEYLPPLDDNRVEVAPPAGWQVPPRDSRWLVHFQEQTSSKYPAIIITAEDYGSDFTVTAENVNEYAKKVAAEQDLGTVKPMKVGRFVGAIYRTRAKQRTGIRVIVDRLFLETVVDGRKYVLELRTRDGSLSEYQPFLYAVAAGMKFGEGPGAPIAAEPANGEKSTESAQAAESEPAGEAKKAAQPGPAEQKSGKQEEKPEEKPKKTAPEKSPKKKPGIDLDKELKGLDDLFE